MSRCCVMKLEDFADMDLLTGKSYLRDESIASCLCTIGNSSCSGHVFMPEPSGLMRSGPETSHRLAPLQGSPVKVEPSWIMY